MKVILLKDVPKVGRKDDIVDVNQGHAINMLIPRKLARPATSGDIASVSKKKELNQKHAIEKVEKGREVLHLLHNKTISIKEKANEKGHLFSKVHTKEILDAIKNEFNISIDKSWIEEFEPIKSIGEHKIYLNAFGERVNLLLNICNR